MTRRKKTSTKLAINVVRQKRRTKKTEKKKSVKKDFAVAELLEEKKKIKRKKQKKNSKKHVKETVKHSFSDERIEREKRLIMWSGVTFFMILVLVFWVYNIKQVFVATKIENDNSDVQVDNWKTITEDFNSQLGEIKDVISEFKDNVSQVKDEEEDVAQTSTLPLNDSVTFSDGTSTKEVVGTSTVGTVEK